MQLSPSDIQAVRKDASAAVVAELRASLGGNFDQFVVVPLQTAGALLGLGAKQVSRRFPTVDLGERRKGVCLADIRKFIEANTHQPEEATA